MKKYLPAIIALLLVLVIGIGWILRQQPDPPAERTNNAQGVAPQPKTPETFNKARFSIDQPDSHWVIVNKKNPLPADYVPALATNILGGQLRPEVNKALDSLISASRSDNIVFKVISGYRSYASQASVYGNYTKSDNQSNVDTYSARPGHSEHQTGLAVDLGNHSGKCDLEICFGDTPGGQWLAAHAHEHGFIIRYQKGKEAITGYQYEPWHLRFVGVELAKELVKTGQTMEEFFGLPAAPNY